MKKYLVFGLLIACSHVQPMPVVIPDDHTLAPVPGKSGYYEISAGYLQNLFDQVSELQAALQQCRNGSGVPALPDGGTGGQ